MDGRLPYHDSFEASMGKVVLDKSWTRYEISLEGKDLTNVIGAFAWVALAPTSRPDTIYIARLQIE